MSDNIFDIRITNVSGTSCFGFMENFMRIFLRHDGRNNTVRRL